MPNLIEDQPEGSFYHIRVQRLIAASSEKTEPEFAPNLTKNAFTMIATKLYNGMHANIAGLAINGIDINTGMVSLMILRTPERKNFESFKKANIETKEQYWNEFRYSLDVDDVSGELDIAMHYQA